MDVTKIFDDRTPKAVRKAENLESRRQDSHHGDVQPRLSALQQSIGNRAVQRLLAQRSSDEPSDLDEGTADRINRGRSEGQLLNTQTQMQMGASLGHDFGNVHVHTSRHCTNSTASWGLVHSPQVKTSFFATEPINLIPPMARS